MLLYLVTPVHIDQKKNKSNFDRKTLYYTYTPLKYGSMYEKYFIDKSKSKNRNSRSLSGEL